MGHTQCGAVGAATAKNNGFIGYITDEIKRAAGDEKDAVKASILNVKYGVAKIKNALKIDGLEVAGALYHTESGAVDFDI